MSVHFHERDSLSEPIGKVQIDGSVMKVCVLSEKSWSEFLNGFLSEFTVFAPLKRRESVEYEEITSEKVKEIYYEGNAPITPLKAFFIPVKENVVNQKVLKPMIVIGVPNCDLAALDLLDNIYLDEEFKDPFYHKNRENTIVFGKDCYSHKDSCHCTAYGLKPYPEKNCDVSMSVIEDTVYLKPMSEKGEAFLKKAGIDRFSDSESLPETVQKERDSIEEKLRKLNENLPDEKETRKGVEKDNEELWKHHASTCVSCGACSFICPTCHCFLLIDRENFEKVKNWDVCQFPGFARVAAGEDPLKPLHERLKYRYLCKYIYKPDMFKAIACTGCGRCIDTCIGKINKNEVIVEACKQG